MHIIHFDNDELKLVVKALDKFKSITLVKAYEEKRNKNIEKYEQGINKAHSLDNLKAQLEAVCD